ncbi:MAG: hypothetical protein ACLUFJ_11145 [Roseburia faecis]
MNQCSKKSMFRCRNCNHINCDMYTKIYAIFTTVVKCFILACGISLLLFFFYDNELEPTKDNIKCVVSIIYTNLLTVVVITYLLKKLIGSIKEDVVNAKPYGKAQIGNKEKTYENIREIIAQKNIIISIFLVLTIYEHLCIYFPINERKRKK